MEIANKFANKLAGVAVKALNSEAVINTGLVASFAFLVVRSVRQQNDIEALESEKASLLQTNKALKKTIWDWKQQLYAEAAMESAVVPLCRIKSIYGEAPASTAGTLLCRFFLHLFNFFVILRVTAFNNNFIKKLDFSRDKVT